MSLCSLFFQVGMPEGCEINVFVEQIRRSKGAPYRPDPQNRMCKYIPLQVCTFYAPVPVLTFFVTDFPPCCRISLILIVTLHVHPHIFATGTEKKPYSNISVDTTQFNLPSATIALPSDVSSYADHRSVGQPFRYLLQHHLPSPLIVNKRGKLMILATGQVSSFTIPSLGGILILFAIPACDSHQSRAGSTCSGYGTINLR